MLRISKARKVDDSTDPSNKKPWSEFEDEKLRNLVCEFLLFNSKTNCLNKKHTIVYSCLHF